MSANENIFGYSAAVWSRFSEPRHAGRIAAGPGVIHAQAGSPAARATLRLDLRLDGERIAEARFQAYGCPVGIAVGEWLAEQASGQSLESLGLIDAAAIRDALEIGQDKAHCALMGEDVLRALMKQTGH